MRAARGLGRWQTGLPARGCTFASDGGTVSMMPTCVHGAGGGSDNRNTCPAQQTPGGRRAEEHGLSLDDGGDGAMPAQGTRAEPRGRGWRKARLSADSPVDGLADVVAGLGTLAGERLKPKCSAVRLLSCTMPGERLPGAPCTGISASLPGGSGASSFSWIRRGKPGRACDTTGVVASGAGKGAADGKAGQDALTSCRKPIRCADRRLSCTAHGSKRSALWHLALDDSDVPYGRSIGRWTPPPVTDDVCIATSAPCKSIKYGPTVRTKLL